MEKGQIELEYDSRGKLIVPCYTLAISNQNKEKLSKTHKEGAQNQDNG